MSDVWLFNDDDHDWQISKKFGGGSHGIFQDTILAFAGTH
jgi:hypothetical protein